MAFTRIFSCCKHHDNAFGLSPNNTEEDNLRLFLKDQPNLKKMKHIRLQYSVVESNAGKKMQVALDAINQLKTFGAVVNIFDDIMANYIQDLTDSSVKYKCMSLFLRPATIFSKGADFIFQFKQLRDAAADVMVRFDYTLPPRSLNAI